MLDLRAVFADLTQRISQRLTELRAIEVGHEHKACSIKIMVAKPEVFTTLPWLWVFLWKI